MIARAAIIIVFLHRTTIKMFMPPRIITVGAITKIMGATTTVTIVHRLTINNFHHIIGTVVEEEMEKDGLITVAGGIMREEGVGQVEVSLEVVVILIITTTGGVVSAYTITNLRRKLACTKKTDC